VQVQVIKSARLNGRDVGPGEVVELNNALAAAWLAKGLARSAGQRGPGRPPKQPKRQKPVEKAVQKPVMEKAVSQDGAEKE